MAKDVRDSKDFKRLLSLLNGDDKAAVEAWNATHPDKPIGTTEVDPATLSSKDQADVLVAQAGMIHIRGRVYSNTTLIEAQVRVLKTGKPEIVRLTGDRHTKGVAVWRHDDGTVALQNLGVTS